MQKQTDCQKGLYAIGVQQEFAEMATTPYGYHTVDAANTISELLRKNANINPLVKSYIYWHNETDKTSI